MGRFPEFEFKFIISVSWLLAYHFRVDKIMLVAPLISLLFFFFFALADEVKHVTAVL